MRDRQYVNEIMNEIDVPKIIPLTQFIDDFGDSLMNAVSIQNPPVYQGVENESRKTVLNGLKRKPFAAQQQVVQAVTKLLIDKGEKAAIINAEMGTGKTMMGIATAAVMQSEGYSRTLILSPPHLVYKWRREILDTVTNAVVWVLNGSDTLLKLMQLRQQLKNEKTEKSERPEFFILGRVRLRMGFQWRPAFSVKKYHVRYKTNEYDLSSPSLIRTTEYVACSACGHSVKDKDGHRIEVTHFPTDKMLNCPTCSSPLWTSIRAAQPVNSHDHWIKKLCELPTIGKKGALELLQQYGEDFIANMLGDNIHQFINLMDEHGQFVFSDKKARRLEKKLFSMECSSGETDYQTSEFIKRYLPQGYFSLLILDEGHEYKNGGSAQGQAMGVIASKVKKILLLTGTLMGGYAEDVFFLLWRIMPQRMIEEGYAYYRQSLSGASFRFMENHGILKTVSKESDSTSYKTARGKRKSIRVSKAPGFSPKGVAQYVLPYTAFLKLNEIGQVLPAYEEQLVEVEMTEHQQVHYDKLKTSLVSKLRAALSKHDMTLLGLILHCLLAWPDCCFREEEVIHPRTKARLVSVPVVLDESASPKEQKMMELCKEAKSKNRRVLVYTTYTGKRDTAERLKRLLDEAGLKAVILRSSIKSEKREEWILDKVDQGIDVLICHPELVKTGLDLLDFPCILFMQSGFNLYTLMQASRRSWRIGQTEHVKVFFLGYKNTTQMDCLGLMAKKIAVSQSTSGTMPETGLDVLSQDGDAIEVTLAKQLIQRE